MPSHRGSVVSDVSIALAPNGGQPCNRSCWTWSPSSTKCLKRRLVCDVPVGGVRAVRGEVAFDEIWCSQRSLVLACREHLPTTADTPQTHLAHESGDLVASDVFTLAADRFPHFSGPVDGVVRLEQHQDQRGQHHIPGCSRGLRSGLGGVVGAGGDLQNLADRRDPQLGTVGVDERHHHLCGRSSSAA